MIHYFVKDSLHFSVVISHPTNVAPQCTLHIDANNETSSVEYHPELTPQQRAKYQAMLNHAITNPTPETQRMYWEREILLQVVEQLLEPQVLGHSDQFGRCVFFSDLSSVMDDRILA